MTDLALDLVRDGETHRPHHCPAFRTLLAGAFAAPSSGNRSILEGLLRTGAALRAHRLLPVHCDRDLDEQAEQQLASDAVDIVLLDLDGPLLAVLSLIGRLRAAAGAGVVFIGILPPHASAEPSLYLGAVLDAVVDATRPDALHRAITEALQAAAEFVGVGYGVIATGRATRH